MKITLAAVPLLLLPGLGLAAGPVDFQTKHAEIKDKATRAFVSGIPIETLVTGEDIKQLNAEPPPPSPADPPPEKPPLPPTERRAKADKLTQAVRDVLALQHETTAGVAAPARKKQLISSIGQTLELPASDVAEASSRYRIMAKGPIDFTQKATDAETRARAQQMSTTGGGAVDRARRQGFKPASGPGATPDGAAGEGSVALGERAQRELDQAASRDAMKPHALRGYYNKDVPMRGDPNQPLPQDASRYSPEVQRIAGSFQTSVDRMDKEGLRRPGSGSVNGVLNNVDSMLLPGNKYVRCYEQSDEVLKDLSKTKLGGTWDDQLGVYRDNPNKQWTFEKKTYFGEGHEADGHYWVEARSSDPNDPTLIMDPWKNEVRYVREKEPITQKPFLPYAMGYYLH